MQQEIKNAVVTRTTARTPRSTRSTPSRIPADEFQRSPDVLRKEEVVANLANFAYDPINYTSLCRLRIMDLFLDILDADQEDDDQESKQQTTTSTKPARTSHLVEFALKGICNCIPNPLLQQQFIDGDGLEIVAPYMLQTSVESDQTSAVTASELNISVSALIIAYFLLDSSVFAEITSQRFMTKLQSLQRHGNVQIANTCAAFVSRCQELSHPSVVLKRSQYKYQVNLVDLGENVSLRAHMGEDEMQTLLELLKYVLLGTNVFLFVTAALVFFTASVPENSGSLSTPAQFKRALIVTSHPDDESMFFLPLVHSLQQQPEGCKDLWQTHLLCLSRGNFDSLGDVREKELKACATYIGLSTDHVTVLEDPMLQDGMKTQWDVAHIASIVANYVDKNKIDAVFTFDDYGVSGHANHIATHYGVKRALQEVQEKCRVNAGADDEEAKVVRGWALESTNMLRKYVGVLDTALSYWRSRRQDEDKHERQFVFLGQPRWNYNAMALHQSQFVWYRRLFVVFSRYTFINTFRPLLSVGTADLPTEQKKRQ